MKKLGLQLLNILKKLTRNWQQFAFLNASIEDFVQNLIDVVDIAVQPIGNGTHGTNLHQNIHAKAYTHTIHDDLQDLVLQFATQGNVLWLLCAYAIGIYNLIENPYHTKAAQCAKERWQERDSVE